MNSKPWWQKPSRIIPLAIVGLVLFGLVAFKLGSTSGLKRELAEARAKGLPTNPKELDAWYAAVPPDENAALAFWEAHKVYTEPGKGANPADVDWRKIAHDEPLDEATVEMLAAVVEKNQETLKQMHEAARLKQSRYPIDLSLGPEVLLTHLFTMKPLVSLARWEAVLKAEREDAAGAVQSLMTGFALAHTLAQEPLLFSELVRIAYIAIQLQGMNRVVNVARFDDAQLAELAVVVREAAEDCSRSLHRSVIGERAFANTGKSMTFDDYEAMYNPMPPFAGPPDESPDFWRKLAFYGKKSVGIYDRDFGFYIHNLGRLIDATALEHPELLQETEKIEAEVTAEMSARPWAYSLSSISLGSILRVPEKEVILAAQLRCVAAGLEIERFRLKNGGRLPGENELVPGVFEEMPTDPVDGKALKIEGLEKGYRVLAVAATKLKTQKGAPARVDGAEFKMVR